MKMKKQAFRKWRRWGRKINDFKKVLEKEIVMFL